MPEQPIWTGSPSQLKNVIPFFFAGIAALAIMFVTFVIYDWTPGLAFIAIPALYILWRRLVVVAQRYELTSERLITTHGFFSRTTDILELYRVKDMRILQPFLLRLWGLEQIELMTGDISSPLLILDHIPSKLRLADKIRAQVEACRVAKGAREVEME